MLLTTTFNSRKCGERHSWKILQCFWTNLEDHVLEGWGFWTPHCPLGYVTVLTCNKKVRNVFPQWQFPLKLVSLKIHQRIDSSVFSNENDFTLKMCYIEENVWQSKLEAGPFTKPTGDTGGITRPTKDAAPRCQFKNFKIKAWTLGCLIQMECFHILGLQSLCWVCPPSNISALASCPSRPLKHSFI